MLTGDILEPMCCALVQAGGSHASRLHEDKSTWQTLAKLLSAWAVAEKDDTDVRPPQLGSLHSIKH